MVIAIYSIARPFFSIYFCDCCSRSAIREEAREREGEVFNINRFAKHLEFASIDCYYFAYCSLIFTMFDDCSRR